MNTSASSVGRWAIVGAVVISVAMAALALTNKVESSLALGLIVVSIATASFLALFYSRTNVVQRTGMMSLGLVAFIVVLLPFFLVRSSANNAEANVQQYKTQLHYAAGLYATYCASCHGLLGQGISGPQLNGSKHVDTLYTSDDIRRILTGGIPDAQNPTLYLMPQWGQTYGGPFNDDDINSLVAFIMSSDSVTRAKVSAVNDTNGFSIVQSTLTTDAQKKQYADQISAQNRPKDLPIDLTALSAVTIPIVNTPTDSAAQWNFIYTDKASGVTSRSVKIKAGTKVTWVNQSSVPHSIISGAPNNETTDFVNDSVINQNATYDQTFTKAGTFPYFCSFHPAMLAQITVVP